VKQVAASAAVGLLFGAGLGLSGMTQADKIIGFLDLSHEWDPSLAFVMLGAIAVHFVLFRLILRRPTPLFAQRFGIPTRADLTPRLVVGSGLFGVGWALGGYCPGPGLVSAATGAAPALLFVFSMLVGMRAFRSAEEAWTARKEPFPAGSSTRQGVATPSV
jgi:uncharacterized protein